MPLHCSYSRNFHYLVVMTVLLLPFCSLIASALCALSAGETLVKAIQRLLLKEEQPKRQPMSSVGSTEVHRILVGLGFQVVDGHKLYPLTPALSCFENLQAFPLHTYENEADATPHYLDHVEVGHPPRHTGYCWAAAYTWVYT
jgi:uncharacterized protein YhhL (DUF1145 family)